MTLNLKDIPVLLAHVTCYAPRSGHTQPLPGEETATGEDPNRRQEQGYLHFNTIITTRKVFVKLEIKTAGKFSAG